MKLFTSLRIKQKNKSIFLFVLVSIAIWLLLTSCGFTSSAQATITAEMVLTNVAETVAFHLSQTPPATATHTATVTPMATPTETPTNTPSPTSSFTPTDSTGGSTGTKCESAAFISDVTIPDGTQFAPGIPFTKTWRLKNNGSCPWTTEFSIALQNGHKMGGVSPQKLPSRVESEFSRDITISLVAPTQPGTYTGYWQLQNVAGVAFGDQFFVEIRVVGNNTITTSPTVTVVGVATSTETSILNTATNTSVPADTPTDVPTETPTP